MANYYKIVISINDDTLPSHKLRKKLQYSLFGNRNSKHPKNGRIYNFFARKGFAPVMDDFCSDYPNVLFAFVESPPEYCSPYEVVVNNVRPCFIDNGLWEFSIPVKGYKHPDSDFSYNEAMFIYLANFLKNAYPRYCVTFQEIPDVENHELADDVLALFYKDIDPENNHLTIETSIPRLLTPEEVNKIEDCLSQVVPYSISISQNFCETCAEYDATTPYHIEVVYN